VVIEEDRGPNRHRGLSPARRGSESQERVRLSLTEGLGHGSDWLSRLGHEKTRESGLGHGNMYGR
jgi:hypothetical protein